MHSLEPDHVILLTPSLQPAVDAFESAGFTVLSGGRFPESVPFHNALVVFGGEFYIELLGIRSRARRLAARALNALGLFERRFRGRALAEARIFGLLGRKAGFVDLCARAVHWDVEDLARRTGTRWEAISMQRETPSRAIASWELAFPADARLPFLIRDFSARGVRIPAAPAHPNGIRRIERLDLALQAAAQVRPAYAGLFGGDPEAFRFPQALRIILSERTHTHRSVMGLTLTLERPSSHERELQALAKRFRGLRISGVTA